MNEKSKATESATSLMEEILEKIGLAGEVFAEESEEEIKVTVKGENLGLLIGRHGKTLDALQFLLSIVANKEVEPKKRLNLDIEDYKKKRAEDLEALALRSAEKALAEGMPVALMPMKASERRLIHLTLKNHTEIETGSEGEEPNRRVIISPKQTPK